MPLPRTTALLLLCSVTLLTGCVGDPPLETRTLVVTEYRATEIPKSLKTCADAPAVPGNDATQRHVAGYIVHLKAARDECAAKLTSVAKISDQQQQAVKEANRQNLPNTGPNP